MRKIFRIAKLELSTLFYSPVAWLILVIFIFQAGVQFMDSMDRLDSMRLMGYGLSGITTTIYTFRGEGLFDSMLSKLYLYIPLLTMGLMSRETSSGSIKLLLSSPVKMKEIIFGKFLAMMAYGFILISILFLFVLAGMLSVQSLDTGMLISGLIALYLVICAYSAIGLFMSSLTSYQVVAAISTLAVLAGLNYVGLVGQKIDIVRQITYFLSISGRAELMIGGLLNTKDILYFVIVVGMFLGLSILKLQAARESKPVAVKAGRYALLVAVALFMGTITSMPTLIGYLDMTATKSETLTPNSQKIINDLKGDVSLTTYSNLLDDKSAWAFPEGMYDDMKHFDQYIRFIPKMKMDYVYYYDTCSNSNQSLSKINPGLSTDALAKKMAYSYKVDFDLFMPPSEIRKQVDLSGEDNHIVRVLQVGDKKTFLRMYDDMWTYPSETEITAAFKRLEVTPPKVAFLVGHNERSIDKDGDKDFKTPAVGKLFRSSLINQGMDVDTISLAKQNIPANVSILIIADPRSPLNAVEQQRLKAFIDKGGDLLIAGEPGKQDLLNPIIATMGLQFEAGTIVQPTAENAPDYTLTHLTKESTTLSEGYDALIKRQATITLPGAMRISEHGQSPFAVTPLLTTKDSTNSWNTLTQIRSDSVPKFSPQSGDTHGAFTTAVALTRQMGGNQQRIIVVGDADFMSNGEFARRPTSTYERLNYMFYQETIMWLNHNSFPVDVSRPETKDNKLKISSPGFTVMRYIFLGVIPAIIIIAGALLLLIRRRK